jgi:hypothetical protein
MMRIMAVSAGFSSRRQEPQSPATSTPTMRRYARERGMQVSCSAQEQMIVLNTTDGRMAGRA